MQRHGGRPLGWRTYCTAVGAVAGAAGAAVAEGGTEGRRDAQRNGLVSRPSAPFEPKSQRVIFIFMHPKLGGAASPGQPVARQAVYGRGLWGGGGAERGVQKAPLAGSISYSRKITRLPVSSRQSRGGAGALLAPGQQ